MGFLGVKEKKKTLLRRKDNKRIDRQMVIDVVFNILKIVYVSKAGKTFRIKITGIV